MKIFLLSFWAHFLLGVACIFIRTKTEPPIYYLPNKPLDEDATSSEKRKEEVGPLDFKNFKNCQAWTYVSWSASNVLGKPPFGKNLAKLNAMSFCLR